MTSNIQDLFAPSIQSLLNKLNMLIGPIYLVGGTVRNMLDHKPLANELNLLVQRPLPECFDLLREGGGSFLTLNTKQHKVWTAGYSSLILPLKKGNAGETLHPDDEIFHFAMPLSHIEIATCRHRPDREATIEEDLLHRDLTVNAMAFAWPNGPLIDPFHGKEDLAQRRIRLVNGITSLEDDPLRALRYFRFLLQLEGSSDERERDMASEYSLESIPPKKLRAELDRFFSLSFSGTARQKIVHDFFYSPLAQDIFSDMATPPICNSGATPAHRCRWAIQVMSEISEPEADEIIPWHDLRWTAMFYAMGELNCIAREKGHTRSALHGLSTRKIQEILKQFRFSQRRQQHIFQMLQHMDSSLVPTDRTLTRLMHQGIPIPGLFRLVHALQSARAKEPNQPTEIDTPQGLDKQLGRVLNRYRSLQQATQRLQPKDLAISGGEILDLVRLPQGEWMRELIDELLAWISQDRTRNQRAMLYDKIREWIANGNRY
ncbi:CCA tRNA nucleotidyltransferase [Candidatus Magnetaquicoccus inordinatus]|uniref:CCA tRNA nucleotidyltransferase n=1 Tax=Candidatus Magnetaquicoccus inordinatus TaxID=2496818 RepID=UPI00102C4F1F|nr:CCA tRNA nucleotidyltransferase [Candidatus Magnetaquicoccus inordinatus]